jgi:hypothetical protein
MLKFHKTCKTLPIYNFNELVKASDVRYLLVDWNEYEEDDLNLSDVELFEGHEILNNIFYEYSELTSNFKVLSEYRTKINILKEEFIYDTTCKVLEFYLQSKDVEILNVLPRLKWDFDITQNIDEQLNKISLKMRSLKTKIDLLKIKYAQKYESKTKDDKATHTDRLEKDALMLELNLKLNYSIDTRKISVSRWIGMCNLASEKAAQIKQM